MASAPGGATRIRREIRPREGDQRQTEAEKMEDALQKLMKESGSTKYAAVATAAHTALGQQH